jgi:hypothetical protein
MSKNNVGLNGEDVLHFLLTITLKKKGRGFPRPADFLFPADQTVFFLPRRNSV